jgi:hypothetical protein
MNAYEITADQARDHFDAGIPVAVTTRVPRSMSDLLFSDAVSRHYGFGTIDAAVEHARTYGHADGAPLHYYARRNPSLGDSAPGMIARHDTFKLSGLSGQYWTAGMPLGDLPPEYRAQAGRRGQAARAGPLRGVELRHPDRLDRTPGSRAGDPERAVLHHNDGSPAARGPRAGRVLHQRRHERARARERPFALRRPREQGRPLVMRMTITLDLSDEKTGRILTDHDTAVILRGLATTIDPGAFDTEPMSVTTTVHPVVDPARRVPGPVTGVAQAPVIGSWRVEREQPEPEDAPDTFEIPARLVTTARNALQSSTIGARRVESARLAREVIAYAIHNGIEVDA